MNILNHVLNGIPNPVEYNTLDGTIIDCNTAFEKLFNLNRENIVNKNYFDILPEQIALKSLTNEKILKHSKFNKNFVQYEQIIEVNNINQRFLVTKSFFYDDKNNPHGIVTILSNITERKEIEKKLEKALTYKQVLSTISSIFVQKYDFNDAVNLALYYMGKTVDASCSLIFHYDKKSNMLKLKNRWLPKELETSSIDIYDMHVEEFPWWYNKLKNGYFVHIADIDNMTIDAKNEQEHFKKQNIKSLIAIPILIDDKFFGYIGFDNILNSPTWDSGTISFLQTCSEIFKNAYIRNFAEKELENKNMELENAIENLKNVQSKLIQQEKLAGIGQLAAGIAHEINNPLGYLFSNMDTLVDYVDKFKKLIHMYRNFSENINNIPQSETENKLNLIRNFENDNYIDFSLEDLDELFKDSQDGLNRVKEIVNSLRTFSHVDQTSSFVDYDLNESIKHTLVILRNELKYNCKIQNHFGKIPSIKAIGGQINQVLLNIILNSSHSIKEKYQNEFGTIKISTYSDTNFVYCEIEDNGLGINKANINKIFNPFFTTKPIGKGTGLGLSIAYDIITNKHKGSISVKSTEGIMTKFTIKLPIDH